jgi:transcriptional regulator with XRE-family HTH domain
MVILMTKTDWVRSMRIKQGLKGFQLAERLQVSAARVSVLEKDEMRGAVTLKMMARVAKAMGCRFEYQLVPLPGKAPAEDKNGLNIGTEPLSFNDKPRVRVVAK